MNEVSIEEEKEILAILKQAEDKLTESIGRYEAQRFIHLFRNLDGFDLYLAIFNKGKEIGRKQAK